MLCWLRPSSAAALNPGQCRRLALNGWEPDLGGDAAGSTNLAKQLDAAAEHCPADARIERARLKIFAAGYATQAEADALKAGQPPSEALRAHVAAVDEVLATEAHRAAGRRCAADRSMRISFAP